MPTNNAPVLSGLGDTPSFVNDVSVILDSDQNSTVSDAELDASPSNYAGATLTLARNGGANPDDSFGGTGPLDLVDVDGNGDNVSLDGGVTFIGAFTAPGDGSFSITFNANATAADIDSVMRNIVYSNASVSPPPSVQINFRFSDGNGDPQGQPQGTGPTPGIATGSVTVSITRADQAPVLDLDANDSSGQPGTDFAAFYVALGAGAPIADTDTSIADVDNATLASATITVTDPQADDLLSVNGTLPGNITASAYDPNTGVLTLSSAGATATLAQWQTALHQVVFSNPDANPDTTTRHITVIVNDGVLDSNTAQTTVTFDQAPVVSAGNTAGYTQAAAPAVLDATLAVSDPDNATLAGARVTITGGFVAGDVLGFSNQNGISGSYDAATHVLTLAGVASVGAYQSALQSVTFASTSDNPTNFGGNPSRQISWVANDGTLDSAAAATTLNLTAVPPPSPFSPDFDTVLAGNFDGANQTDLVFHRAANGTTETLLDKGFVFSGGILSNPGVQTADLRLVGTGDVNGDGKSDLVFLNDGISTPVIQFLDGTTPAGGGPPSVNPFDRSFTIVGVGDANGDGRADLVWHRASDGLSEVQFLNGTTSAGGGVISNSAFQSTDWQIVAVGDFNGDGKSDLIFNGLGVYEIQFLDGITPIGGGLINNSAFTLPEWHVVGVGDFNGDGHNDLVFHDVVDNRTEIQFLNGITPAGGGLIDNPALQSPDLQVAGVGDFNGDGHLDLVFHNAATGNTVIQFLNGITPIGGGTLNLH